MAEAAGVDCVALVHKLAKAMTVEVEDLNPSQPANLYSVDSLVAIEIQAWVFKEVKSDVSVIDILSNKLLASPAGTIAAESAMLYPLIKDIEGYM